MTKGGRELLSKVLIESSCQGGWSNQRTCVFQAERGHVEPMIDPSWCTIQRHCGSSFLLLVLLVGDLKSVQYCLSMRLDAQQFFWNRTALLFQLRLISLPVIYTLGLLYCVWLKSNSAKKEIMFSCKYLQDKAQWIYCGATVAGLLGNRPSNREAACCFVALPICELEKAPTTCLLDRKPL